MSMNNVRWSALALASTAALALSACENSGSYRVASVGASGGASTADDSGGGSAGGGSGSGGSTAGGGSGSGSTGSGGTQSSLGRGVLVTSGNAVLGASDTASGVLSNSNIPKSGLAEGIVTAVLNKTGQTLVELGNGGSVLLDRAGGRVGDVVAINLGKGAVTRAPDGSSLVGVNVLARNPSTGKLVSLGALSGDQLVSVDVSKGGVSGIPRKGVASARVTAILHKAKQTLVQLRNGSSLILNGTGGRIGDLVALDLGRGRVIGGSSGSPLVGLNVLARNPSTGRLVTVSAATSGRLASVTAPGIPGPGGLVGGVPGGGSLTATVNGAVQPGSGASLGSSVKAVTKPVTTTLGVNGGLTTPPK
jgi:hypothetical protein